MMSKNYNVKVPDIKLLSLNVRGLNKEVKRKSIFQYIRRQKVDISFLQETYGTSNIENIWTQQWGGKAVYSHGTHHSRGVMILMKPGLDMEILNSSTDPQGRYIYLKVVLQGNLVQLLNIYAPNAESEQISFYKEVKTLLVNNYDQDATIFIGGDFNTLLNPELDRKGGNFCNTKNYERVRNEIEDLIEQCDLCDIWRIKYPEKKGTLGDKQLR